MLFHYQIHMNTIFDKLHEFDPRLTVSILDLVAKRKGFSGRVEESSFRRIPAVKSFSVTPGDENILLVNSGLDRKLPSNKKWELGKIQNRLNKYMAFRIRAMRIVLRKGRPDIFGAMVERDMKHSTAFRMSAFNSVVSGWYKNKDMQRVYGIMFGVNKIIKNDLVNLKYFRVEIPKGSPEEIVKFFAENPGKPWPGKKRPLGVPTTPGRVVLHMGNGFLTVFLEEELKRFNHAYMPGVGTNTAIEKFIAEVRNYKYIFEFDIKGFFNNVSIADVIKLLKQRGMPRHLNKRLFQILGACPSNINGADKDSMKSEYDESLGKRKAYIVDESAIPMTLTNEGPIKKDWTDDNILDNDIVVSPRYRPSRLMAWTLEASMARQLLKGLPQGAAPSTILSLLALSKGYEQLKTKGINLHMYADDGILYSDHPFDPFPPEGFEFAEDKSRGVRMDAPVQEEIKFLGIIYDFSTKLIRGATRNGSTLEFGAEQKEVLELVRKLMPGGHSSDLMSSLVGSNIFGLVLSKLYGGKFGRLQYQEKVEYDERSYGGRFHDIEKLKKDRGLQRKASSIACGGLRLLTDHSMGKINRPSFHLASVDYHIKKEGEEHISEEDIRAAYKGQTAWDAKNG